MFTGLSVFPLTPLSDDTVDESAFVGVIRRLAAAEVDSITALGSTGSHAYLSAQERSRVAHLAVEHAGNVPVFVGIGALRTSHDLAHLEHAQQAGASAVLLAPMTYQPLTDDDVLVLFRTVTAHSSVPVIVCDNPGTTHVALTTELCGRIAELPGIASIKIPAVPADPQRARARRRGGRRVRPAGPAVAAVQRVREPAGRGRRRRTAGPGPPPGPVCRSRSRGWTRSSAPGWRGSSTTSDSTSTPDTRPLRGEDTGVRRRPGGSSPAPLASAPPVVAATAGIVDRIRPR